MITWAVVWMMVKLRGDDGALFVGVILGIFSIFADTLIAIKIVNAM